MKITQNELIRLGACQPGLDRFRKQTNDTDQPVEIISLIGGRNTTADMLWLAETLLKQGYDAELQFKTLVERCMIAAMHDIMTESDVVRGLWRSKIHNIIRFMEVGLYVELRVELERFYIEVHGKLRDADDCDATRQIRGVRKLVADIYHFTKPHPSSPINIQMTDTVKTVLKYFFVSIDGVFIDVEHDTEHKTLTHNKA